MYYLMVYELFTELKSHGHIPGTPAYDLALLGFPFARESLTRLQLHKVSPIGAWIIVIN